HRIELGEIETALQQVENVQAAVVTAVENGEERRLVAYVVLKPAVDDPLAAPLEPEGLPAVAPLADDLAKLEFKLSEPGLRRDLGDMPRVDLPSRPTDGPWLAAFRDRRSHRTFLSESISFADFGRGLGALAEEEGAGRPRFAASDPSLEIFVGVKPGRVEGVVGGLYRYDPAWHRLVLVEAGLEIGPLAHASVNRVIAESAAFNVLLVGSASGEAHDAGL